MELGEDLVPSALAAVVVLSGDDPLPALARELAVDRADPLRLPETPAVLLVFTQRGVSAHTLAPFLRWRDARPGRALIACAPDGSSEDSERALAAGVDDFVAGHGSARELAARVRALIRRTRRRASEQLRWGRISVDAERHEAWVDGRRIGLTTMELALLSRLVEVRGKALSRVELLDQVWGKDNLEVGLRAVDNLVLRLRRKLGSRVIVTVRGAGFRVADR